MLNGRISKNWYLSDIFYPKREVSVSELVHIAIVLVLIKPGLLMWIINVVKARCTEMAESHARRTSTRKTVVNIFVLLRSDDFCRF